MSGKKRTAGNGSQEKNRLFTQANAAWDKGDLRQAFALFMQAAKLGDVSCQLDLGYFFDQGLSVKKDKKKALEWYRRAYRQGDAGAANNIATVYRDLGDTRKMLWWFRRAAAMGDLDVLLDLDTLQRRPSGRLRRRGCVSGFFTRSLGGAIFPGEGQFRFTATDF